MAGELGGSPTLDAALDPVGPHPIVGDDVRTVSRLASTRWLQTVGPRQTSVGVFGWRICRGRFPRINALVDVCNVVSLHSGLPISLLDLDLLQGVAADGLSIRVMPERTSYVFNLSGQTIDASGLLALCDRDGPAGTPVKDAQRTKTHAGTVRHPNCHLGQSCLTRACG